MATVLDTLQKGTDYLEKHGVENGRLNMQQMLAHVLKCDRMQVYVNFDRELNESQLGQLREMTRKRAKGEPLQHLLGTVEFLELEFKVDARALIPRHETEELADRCRKLTLPETPRILDMGCGSGVLGLSLAHHLDNRKPKIILADVSAEALTLAEENRLALVPEADVTLVKSDLFSELKDNFDLIVANLPYIPESEKTSLSREVLQDPDMALYGGPEGTELLARLFQEIDNFTSSGSQIALEFGIDQEQEIARLADEAQFEKIRIVRDLSGINRFLFATKI